MLLNNLTEITDYFETEQFRTDEIILLKNDIYLTGSFVKGLVVKLGGKVHSFVASLNEYYWRDNNKIEKEGIGFPISAKGAPLYFDVRYDGSNYRNSINIRNDNNGVIHFSIKGKRRSLKVSNTVVINVKWLISQIEDEIKNVVAEVEDKRVANFQAGLAVPWMTQMLIDIGIGETEIVATRSSIEIKNFDRKAYWSTIVLYVDTSESATSFDSMLWSINIKNKIIIPHITGNNIVKILEVFKASGYFKKMI